MNDDKWIEQFKKWREEYNKASESMVRDALVYGTGYWYVDEPDKIDSEVLKESMCTHDFKEYHGFNDAFKYCIYCDKKEKL